MNLFIFDRLFSKEKKGGRQESIVCFGRMNNGEIFISPAVCLDERPLNAVIYNRFLSFEDAQRFSDAEHDEEVLYCDAQEYTLLTMFNSVGCCSAIGDVAWNKILELARRHLIDVVVLQDMSRLSDNFEEVVEILEILYRCGVKVDCMGYGILEQEILYQYIEEARKKMQMMEERIREVILESMEGGMER